MSEELALFLERTIKKENVDLVINVGDFLSETYANKIADIIGDAGIRGIFVEGNWDNNLKIENKRVKKLSNDVYKIKGYYFYGVDEKVFWDEEDLIEKTKNIDNKKLIFLTHEPPRGVLDKIWSGASVGNVIYKRYVEIKKPLIHCFGHIHEANGIKRGETTFINAAMADIKRAYLVSLPSLKIKKIEKIS